MKQMGEIDLGGLQQLVSRTQTILPLGLVRSQPPRRQFFIGRVGARMIQGGAGLTGWHDLQSCEWKPFLEGGKTTWIYERPRCLDFFPK